METKYNVVVFSKNKKSDESTSSLNVKLTTPLQCGDKEYFSIELDNFNMIKSFYDIQTGFNSVFYIILKNEAETNEYIRSIPAGNYNVYSLLTKMQELCFELVKVEYDNVVNKLKFLRVENEATAGYELYIKCINCGSILGMPNDEEKLIPIDDIYESDTFVNIIGYSTLLIKLSGITITNSFSNVNNTKYDVNKIIQTIDIGNVRPMDSILYFSNGGNNNKYNVYEKILSDFTVEIVNENNDIFPQMSDYIATFVIKKNKIDMDMDKMYGSILKRLNDLIYYISALFQHFEIV